MKSLLTRRLALNGIRRPPVGAASGLGVDRRHVHRYAASQVLLEHWRRTDGDGFVVAARWPADHDLYPPLQGRWHDPLLMVESVRQAGLLIGHGGLGVPLGHQFALRALSIRIPEPVPVSDGSDVTISVTCSDLAYQDGMPSRVTYGFRLCVAGREIAVASITTGLLPPGIYARLRGGRGPAEAGPSLRPVPATPASVGRERQRDVVIAAASMQSPGGRATVSRSLHVDSTHPVYFDHPLDHVPGMLLLDAARQIVHAESALPLLPLSVDIEFSRYVELDAPTLVELDRMERTVDGEVRARVSGTQGGTTAFRCQLSMATRVNEAAGG